MKFCRMFVYDLKNSLKYNMVIYLLAALVLVLVCMNYGSIAKYYSSVEQFGAVGYQEYLLNLVRGMEKIPEYSSPKGSSSENSALGNSVSGNSVPQRQINLPLAYVGIAICISYITGRYIFNNSAYTVLVQGRSRTAWIVSKSLTTGVEIALVYGMMLVVSLLFGGAGGDVEISRCAKLMKIDSVQPQALEQPLFLVLTLLVPAVTAYAIAQLQIAVSLIFNNVAGFITAILIYFGSVFEYNLLMLGNGCMVQRSLYFMDNGLSVKMILLLDMVVIIAAIAAQIAAARKKDW